MTAKRRIYLNVFWMILGILLLSLSALGKLNDMYGGMGGGFLGVGIVQLIRSIRYQTNQAYKEMVDIEVNDERNKYIRMMAWSWTGYLMVMLCGILCILCLLLNLPVYTQIAGSVVCLILILYWISYAILKRKN